METPVCRMLGMEYPIVQAAIGSISCPELAAAVSNAGGMGSIAMTGWGYDGTLQRLRRAASLTDRGIIANILLSYDVEAELAAILAEAPKAVSFFWGDVAGYVEPVHDAGALVVASVGSVEEAERAAAVGADIVVAQGWEAGGHVRGTIATMALTPAVVDAVRPVPVIAAGGISDGRGLAAALCLGAQAAWIGTRFLAATEADVHPVYRAEVFRASAADTFYSALFDGGWPGAPGRVIRNSTVAQWEAAGRPERNRPGEGEVIARTRDGDEVQRYEAQAMRAEMQGDIESGALWAGQGVGLVSAEQPAGEIVNQLVSEALECLRQVR